MKGLFRHDQIASMHIKKQYNYNTQLVHSIDFSTDGELLATSSLDESIHVYSTHSGELKSKIISKKYGVGVIKFTNSNHSAHVITASLNGWDDTVRYLSLAHNNYIRYFQGHRSQVTSLSFSTAHQDSFVSSSTDDTIRLWDLRSPICQGLIRLSDPVVSFDPLGMIFAAAIDKGLLNLYDLRYFDGGPFLSWKLPLLSYESLSWDSINFSHDGEWLLLATNSDYIYLVDAFYGTQLQHYKRPNTSNSNLKANFVTLQGSGSNENIKDGIIYVMAGGDDGSLLAWDALSGELLCNWRDGLDTQINSIMWNPKKSLLATASSQLTIWGTDNIP